ncbi:MAG: hypothetical protein WCF84_24360, partial [Anaerolineae bacterium]
MSIVFVDHRRTGKGMRAAVVFLACLLFALMPGAAHAQGGKTGHVDQLYTVASEAKSSDISSSRIDIVASLGCMTGDNGQAQADIKFAADGKLTGECTSNAGTADNYERLTGKFTTGKVDFQARTVHWELTLTREYRGPRTVSKYGNEIGWFDDTGQIEVKYSADGKLTSDTEASGTASFTVSCTVTYSHPRGDVPYGPGGQCPGSSGDYTQKIMTDTGSGSGTVPWGMKLVLDQAAPPASPLLYTCEPPPKIADDATDRYLDFLGAKLEMAVNGATPYSASPLRAAPIGSTPGMTYKEAADLGREIWDEARGLQRAALTDKITLTFSQVQRTKAYGHWADWLEKRAQPIKRIMNGEAEDFYQEPERLTYPFHGPITYQVPTPPQLVGENIARIYLDEYTFAAALSIAQSADAFYTRGLMWSFYLALREQSLRPLILPALAQIKLLGPMLISAYVGYVEANAYYDPKAPQLTWDQHMQNVIALYTSLLTLGLQLGEPPV